MRTSPTIFGLICLESYWDLGIIGTHGTWSIWVFALMPPQNIHLTLRAGPTIPHATLHLCRCPLFMSIRFSLSSVCIRTVVQNSFTQHGGSSMWAFRWLAQLMFQCVAFAVQTASTGFIHPYSPHPQAHWLRIQIWMYWGNYVWTQSRTSPSSRYTPVISKLDGPQSCHRQENFKPYSSLKVFVRAELCRAQGIPSSIKFAISISSQP